MKINQTKHDWFGQRNIDSILGHPKHSGSLSWYTCRSYILYHKHCCIVLHHTTTTHTVVLIPHHIHIIALSGMCYIVYNSTLSRRSLKKFPKDVWRNLQKMLHGILQKISFHIHHAFEDISRRSFKRNFQTLPEGISRIVLKKRSQMKRRTF